MTTKKRTGVSIAIQHVLDLIDTCSPETAALALVQASEGVTVDLGYETDEAWRLVHFILEQPKDTNRFDLAEAWCKLCRMPRTDCVHGKIPIGVCGAYTDAKLTQWYTKWSPDGICPRCNNGIPHTPKAIVPHYMGTCITAPPEPPKPLSLEEQRRILHETGLFDEMGNFIGGQS
jgi:hypothetical protein